jgi:hypothetical protein
MKFKTRYATNSYSTDAALAAAVMEKQGKKVRYALEENNSRAGVKFTPASTKEMLTDMIRSRRAMLEEIGYTNVTNRQVLDSLGNSLSFKTQEQRGAENAMKGFVNAVLASTVKTTVDENGNVKRTGYVQLPNGKYQDLATGKLVQFHNPDKEKSYVELPMFAKYGFVPGKTELVYVDGKYRFWGTNGKTYELTLSQDYSEGGGWEIEEI